MKGKQMNLDKRDDASNATRDEARDVRRDEARDAKRDETRDAKRDEARDAKRDAYQDAELAYTNGVGRTDAPFSPRQDGDHRRDGVSDPERDGSRRDTRDPARGSAGESTENATSASARDDRSLMVAMAERCRDSIEASNAPLRDQPASLQLKHLRWMCGQVVEASDAWPRTKIHRWVGFIQAGMIANGLLRLDGVQRMFDEVKRHQHAPDQDLLDHLNPEDAFEFDIGGQG